MILDGLTEELERLESEASAVAEPETDVDGAELVERMSVDDSAAEEEQIATPAEPARNRPSTACSSRPTHRA